MRNRLLTLGCAALAALFALPTAFAQQNTGPIRQGVRGVAEGTANAVRRTGEATRNVIRGTAEGTANAVRRTGEAARNLGDNTRDRLRGDADYQQNNQSYNDNQNLNNQNQIDGQYQGEYQSGYRGAEGQTQNDAQNQPMQAGGGQEYSNQGNSNSGQVYQLRQDASGREFICMNGQRVYFDNQHSANSQPTPQRAMYGSEESFQDQYADPSNESNQDRPELNQSGQDNYDSVPPVPQPESANPNQPLNSADQAIQNDANQKDRSSQAGEEDSPQDEQKSFEDDAPNKAESKADSAEDAADQLKESDK